MAVSRLLMVAVLLGGSAAWAQRPMSVAQVQQFVKSSLQQKFPDKQIAEYLKNIQLTDRLELRDIETLQGQGAGPKTLEALRALATASKTLAAPAPVKAAAPPPPPIPAPSKAEQDKVLAEMTRYALDYTKNLPNFTCIQWTRRYAGASLGTRLLDEIQEQLSMVDGHENYVVMLVNNLPVNNAKHTELGGATSSGEFGTELSEIFRAESKTSFAWNRWATLRGRRMHVFAFRIDQPNSDFRIRDGASGREIVAGYHGELFADAETKTVMRIKLDADGLESFPIKRVYETLDYDLQVLQDDPSGKKYVLPIRAEVNSATSAYTSQNLLEFRRYQRFSADSKIIPDVPEEISPDQLEEKPAK